MHPQSTAQSPSARICEQCGNEYSLRQWDRPQRFCSSACYHAAKVRKPKSAHVSCVCVQCGKAFERPRSEVARGQSKYCSSACSKKARFGKPVKKEERKLRRVTCDTCGKAFAFYPSVRPNARYCSRRCASLAHRDSVAGPNNPNWKGGVKAERQAAMARATYAEWRTAVFERDSYTCRHCGKPDSGHLNAHHIVRWKDAPDLRFDLANGVTLCKACHIDIHRAKR